MNEGQFVEFMKKMGGSPDLMKKMEKLLKLSGQAMMLLKKINATPPQDRLKYRDELAAVQEALNNEYQTMLGEMGFTHESLQAYMQNPTNFSPEGWQIAQSVKEQFEQEVNTPPIKEHKSSKSSKRKAWMSA